MTLPLEVSATTENVKEYLREKHEIAGPFKLRIYVQRTAVYLAKGEILEQRGVKADSTLGVLYGDSPEKQCDRRRKEKMRVAEVEKADDEVKRLKQELEKEKAARLEAERRNALLSQENQNLKRERDEFDSERVAWKRRKEYGQGSEVMKSDASASSSCGETLVPPTSESSFTSIEEMSDEVEGLRSPVHDGLFKVNRVLPISKCLIPYLGSKQRLVKKIVAVLLAQMERHRCDRVVSTCLGAGHVEFYLARTGKRVVAHDLSHNVVNLWHQAAHYNESVQQALLALVEKLRSGDREAFFKRARGDNRGPRERQG